MKIILVGHRDPAWIYSLSDLSPNSGHVERGLKPNLKLRFTSKLLYQSQLSFRVF